MSQAPEGYRYHTPITVRFADLDALGHVNNAKYLTYIEQGRVLYVRDVCAWTGGWETFGMILAKVTLDYQLPLRWNDQVGVYTRCERLGGKSFDLSYVIQRENPDSPPDIAATATTVMVAYDYRNDQTIPIPDSWRESILAYEPRRPDGA